MKNELRIGNLVKAPHGELPIAELLKDAANFHPVRQAPWVAVPYGILKPIPLTEEWLKKFGFELVEKQYEAQEFDVYKKGYFTWNSNHGWWFCHVNIQNKAKVEYVHELQNLYFALTKTELVLAVT